MQKVLFIALASTLFILNESFAAGNYAGKKVFFVDSYHEGYAWSDGVTEGVKKVIDISGASELYPNWWTPIETI